MGTSISFTAGVLAWVLRGGSLVASMMAVTPLWNHIDPTRVFYVDKTRRHPHDQATDDVEELFEHDK